MATKKKQPTVTRIKATEATPTKKPTVAKSKKATSTVTKAHVIKAEQKPTGLQTTWRAIIGYFKGAWYELKQVRWPTRRATWSLTVAVMLFTGFFVGLIVLLDALFKYLFELILK